MRSCAEGKKVRKTLKQTKLEISSFRENLDIMKYAAGKGMKNETGNVKNRRIFNGAIGSTTRDEGESSPRSKRIIGT